MRYIMAAILLALALSPVALLAASLALAVFSDSLAWRTAGWVGAAAALSGGAWLLYGFARGTSR